jgi:hypothetical protein
LELIDMKLNIIPVFMSAALFFSGASLADDAPTAQPVKSPRQKLQDCMAQEHASNGTKSADELKKICAAKLQSDENHPSRPQPSADSGRQ